MAAIHQHLPQPSVFEPDAIAAMSQAFDEACAALHVFAGDQWGRETIAMRVIDLASRGVIDPRALRDRVLLDAKTFL